MFRSITISLLSLITLSSCSPQYSVPNGGLDRTVESIGESTEISDGESSPLESTLLPEPSTVLKEQVDLKLLKEFSFIKDASPNAKDIIVQGFSRRDNPLNRYGITSSSSHLLHFLAQSATETGGFRTLTESTSYSGERLLEIFPSRVSPAQANALARRPRETANHVYGDRLGNRAGTDDGWNFRGSGYLQLTGRDNFARAGEKLKIPLLSQPDLARKPTYGLDASLEFWLWRGVDDIAKSGSATVAQVRRAINGGTNGLSETKVWHAVLSDAYRSRGGIRVETGGRGADPVEAAVAEALSELGFLDGPILESTFRDGSYSEALKDFQRSRGLVPSGVLDTDTLYKITDPSGKFEDL